MEEQLMRINRNADAKNVWMYEEELPASPVIRSLIHIPTSKMVMMYRFAFWFSTRFGSLVVAIFTLAQTITALTLCSIWIQQQKSFSNKIDYWLKTSTMMFMTGVMKDMKKDPESYLLGFIIFLSLHCASGLLLIIGTLKIFMWLVYPFLVLELLRLLFITASFIIAMLLVKENIMDLGFLISVCCGGGFVLLFMYYLWFCCLSFVQIVKELKFVQKMGHFQGADLNQAEYQRMNVPELGAEYYSKDDGLASQMHAQNNNYSRKYFSSKMGTQLNSENDYADVLARPVY